MALKANFSEELPAVNLTPMIDVVFLLIIFFMVGTQFSQSEREIGIKLPGAGQLSAMVAPPDRREVAIAADGTIRFDGQMVNPADLVSMLTSLRAKYPDIAVAVRADGLAQHQSVASVLGAVNRAGISNLSIAVRSQTERR